MATSLGLSQNLSFCRLLLSKLSLEWHISKDLLLSLEFLPFQRKKTLLSTVPAVSSLQLISWAKSRLPGLLAWHHTGAGLNFLFRKVFSEFLFLRFQKKKCMLGKYLNCQAMLYSHVEMWRGKKRSRNTFLEALANYPMTAVTISEAQRELDELCISTEMEKAAPHQPWFKSSFFWDSNDLKWYPMKATSRNTPP